MPISFSCRCGKTLQVPDEYAGQEGECPSCGQSLFIPLLEVGEERVTARPPVAAPLARLPQPSFVDEPSVLRPTDHGGGPVTEDDDFFAEAPPEIGRVVTASTTLRVGKTPIAPGMRAAILLAVALCCGAVCFAVSAVLVDRMQPTASLWAALGGTLGLALAGYITRFRQTCSYVGEQGFAAFKCAGSRDRLVGDVFLFGHADELRTGQTRNYHNGAYTGTSYHFKWTDACGRNVHVLSGRYYSEPGTPPPRDPFHFALSAELAWTMFLFRDMERLLSGDGALHFRLKGKDYVQMGEGYIVLGLRGASRRLEPEEIAQVRVESGKVSIWETGAQKGWFTSKGVHSFAYQDIGNARFFLFAFEKLIGMRVF